MWKTAEDAKLVTIIYIAEIRNRRAAHAIILLRSVSQLGDVIYI